MVSVAISIGFSAGLGLRPLLGALHLSIISHGSAAFLKERLMDQSDAYRVHVCQKCGLIAVANLKNQTFECCKNPNERTGIVQIMLPYACKLMFQELMSMGIAPRLLT